MTLVLESADLAPEYQSQVSDVLNRSKEPKYAFKSTGSCIGIKLLGLKSRIRDNLLIDDRPRNVNYSKNNFSNAIKFEHDRFCFEARASMFIR